MLKMGFLVQSESWKRREAVVRYCVSTVDDRLLARDREIRDAGGNEEFERLDRDRARSVREGIYLEETKVGGGNRWWKYECG